MEIRGENFIQIILIDACLSMSDKRWPFFDAGSEVGFIGRSFSSKTRDRWRCSNFGFRSLCLSVVLVAVIIKICCDLRPTNSFCCLLFQPIFTARIVPHLTEPLAHFSHSHSISSLVSSFSLLQNYDFLVHAHLVLDFFHLCICFSKIITAIFTIRTLLLVQ